MAVPTVNVTINVLDPGSNLPLVGAAVTARLTSVDRYAGQILPRDVISGVTDAAGSCVLPLFPNILGEVTGDYCGDGSDQHSGYQFTIRHPSTGKALYKTVARVPNQTVNLTDIADNMCSAGTVATPGGGTGYHDAETPFGVINGVNKNFTLGAAPSPSTTLQLYRNGLLQTVAVDYTLSGRNISYIVAMQVGDSHIAWYRS